MLMHLIIYGFAIVKAEVNDADLSIEEIVKHHGYFFETHEVITDDGYILSLHRIPGKNHQSVFNFPIEEQNHMAV